MADQKERPKPMVADVKFLQMQKQAAKDAREQKDLINKDRKDYGHE